MNRPLYPASRRSFLKASAAGAAGLMLSNIGISDIYAKTTAGWVNGTQINPNIDNLRVVYCTDAAMVTKTPTSWTTQTQNDAINTTQVQANMDKMAIALAQKSDAATAWSTIFMKPNAKAWNAVTVAIKVNAMNAMITPRIAVLDKVCKELIKLQVQPGNIWIYDQGHVADATNNSRCTDTYKTAYALAKLPAGMNIVGALGATAQVSVGGQSLNCAGKLADGSIDILINMTVNKGHSYDYIGLVTLCMKNHTGSIKLKCPSDFNQFIAENQCAPILGTQSAGVPYRQQLCIIDSIFATKADAGNIGPDCQPNSLVMGTFAHAVDYLTIKYIREKMLGSTVNAAATGFRENFLPAFGYSTTERDNLLSKTPAQNNGKGWVNALAWTPPTGIYANNNMAGTRTVELIIKGQKQVILSLPQNENIIGMNIYNAQGKLIRKIDIKNTDNVYWDGCLKSGKSVPNGAYVFSVNGTAGVYTRKFMVTKLF
jgi:hypothetical protein